MVPVAREPDRPAQVHNGHRHLRAGLRDRGAVHAQPAVSRRRHGGPAAQGVRHSGHPHRDQLAGRVPLDEEEGAERSAEIQGQSQADNARRVQRPRGPARGNASPEPREEDQGQGHHAAPVLREGGESDSGVGAQRGQEVLGAGLREAGENPGRQVAESQHHRLEREKLAHERVLGQ